MLDIYISSKSFIASEHNCNRLDNMINGKYISVKAADKELLELAKDPNSGAHRVLMGKDVPLSSGVELCDALLAKVSGKKINGWKPSYSSKFSSSAFFINLPSSELEKKLAANPVVLAKNDEVSSINKFFSGHGWDYFDTLDYPDLKSSNSEGCSWNTIFANVRGLPFNSLVINDRYIARTDRKLEDLCTALKCLLNACNCGVPFHILILVGLPKDSGVYMGDTVALKTIFQNFLDFCISPLSTTYPEMRILVEAVFCDGKNAKLYDITHNRYIITNYSMFKTEQTLAALNGIGETSALQSVMSLSLFSSDFSRKTHDIYLSNIKDCILGSNARENVTKSFVATLYGGMIEKNIEQYEYMNQIKNRLITDIQEGDLCYYLSVQHDNKWIETAVKGPDNYFASNYRSCVCSKSKDKLDRIAAEIRSLMEGVPQEQLAKPGELPFFRINISTPSDVRTIDYVESSSETELKNQITNYRNNHFKDEDYTVSIANKICKILEIEPIQKHK